MSDDRLKEPLRPRDLALLLLASRELQPRRRARDQQADRAGLELKRRTLDRLAALDPEPKELEAVLGQIAHELAPPLGPPLAIAAHVFADWQAACVSPEWVAQLIAQAVKPPERSHRTNPDFSHDSGCTPSGAAVESALEALSVPNSTGLHARGER